MVESNNEIKMKLRKGPWEVEITCKEDQVKQTIENVLSGIGTASQESSTEIHHGTSKATRTCRSLLEDLWKEDWFSIVRNLGLVHEELSRRGYHYDRTAVSHSLTDLVRESVLTRTGSMRSYGYIQKRPA
tara:strand:- start:217 stop:606 length:390 start_codon:yes stop_codon:yes gene_type:complete